MYDSNPTLEMLNIGGKKMDENRQGEVLFAEFDALTEGDGSKKFYIESYGCQMNFSDSCRMFR